MPNVTESEPALRDGLSTWDEVCRLADEIELKLHLGGMSARDRWRMLEPRLVALEEEIEHSGQLLTEEVHEEIALLRTMLQGLRADLN